MLAALTALVVFSGSALAGTGTSFNDLREALYENPRGADLPAWPGLATWDVIRNFIGSENKPTHGLGIRSRRLFVDESDVRDTREPKWLHPRGACAEARWVITDTSAATGLFAAGVSIPAIVRVSSGDAASAYPTSGRIFGMAIKLFPTSDLSRPVPTTNIITLDQAGFERSSRKFVFLPDQTSDPLYFTNVAPARSTLGKFLSTFFDRFDKPNFARPVYATARATVDGASLASSSSMTPYEVRFLPSADMTKPTRDFADFRLELQEKRNRSLQIVLQSFDGQTALAQPIGRLELGDFVVSDFCDLDLAFHHSPIEDQWSKYTDYDVVKDLRKNY